MLKRISLILVVGLVAWGYKAIKPPPPKTCGTPDGPPITAPRIKLRDGRFMAYKEYGVSKDVARHKIVFAHGLDTCRHDTFIATTLSPEVFEELQVYIVSFDRAGYGESDPDTKCSLKTLVLDIEELADQLELGAKFYLVGYSFGGMIGWGCIKYIPHRLAGVALLAPAINYWWPNLPANLTKAVMNQQLPQDVWGMRVAHYAPWLTYWWNTQRIFPASRLAIRDLNVFSRQDMEIIMAAGGKPPPHLDQIRQQGEYESLYKDLNIAMGRWEFDPLDIENPFKDNEEEGSIHIWQGDDDAPVPVELQRFIVSGLPWIWYHEIAGAGHLFPLATGVSSSILKALLFKEK